MEAELTTGRPSNTGACLTSITIEGFRGFNVPTTLDLDASAVLLHGPNGTGKTSVFDAVQWLLTGELPRLASLRLRKTDEYLRNTFMASQVAQVSGVFRCEGQVLTAHRTGDGRTSSLRLDTAGRVLDGESAQTALGEALARGSVPLAELLHTSGLLQQDEMRQLLHTKPDARYRQLMRLLGLEVVDAFDQHIQAQRVRCREMLRDAEVRLAQAKTERGRLRDALETALIQVERASTGGSEFRPEALNLRTEQHLIITSIDEFTEWETLAVQLGLVEKAVATCQRLLDLLPNEDFIADSAAWNDLDAELTQAQRDLEGARKQEELAVRALGEVQASDDLLGRLASAAIPMLQMREGVAPCPVCETEIDVDAVRRSLEQRATGSGPLAAARALVEHARETRGSLETRLKGLLDSQKRAQERRTYLERIQTQREGVFAALRRLTAIEGIRLPVLVGLLQRLDVDSSGAAELSSVRVELASELAIIAAASEQWLDATNTSLEQLSIRRLAAERNAAIPRQRAALVEADHRVADLEAAFDSARARELRLASLARSATSAAGEIFRERFAALEPVMNDVYARLDPHPAFTHLSFEVESFRSKGTATAAARDEEMGVTVNPMLVFSAAQANIVVLSAFLALATASGRSGLPFMFLDDPLQALDDVNVLGFSDLARHVRRERQLVLATHEARFASLLTRKLTGSRPGEDLIVHEFVGWSRSGPEITTTRLLADDRNRRRIIAA